jgi:hypothetical protein
MEINNWRVENTENTQITMSLGGEVSATINSELIHKWLGFWIQFPYFIHFHLHRPGVLQIARRRNGV